MNRGLSTRQRPVLSIAYCVLRIAYCVLRIAYSVKHNMIYVNFNNTVQLTYREVWPKL